MAPPNNMTKEAPPKIMTKDNNMATPVVVCAPAAAPRADDSSPPGQDLEYFMYGTIAGLFSVLASLFIRDADK